jgi:hypothetical protein
MLLASVMEEDFGQIIRALVNRAKAGDQGTAGPDRWQGDDVSSRRRGGNR